jgi:hypothetical protein
LGIGIYRQPSSDLGGCIRFFKYRFDCNCQYFDRLDAESVMAIWLAPIAAAIGSGVGKVISKLVDYIPGREESLRNNLQKLEKEREQIMSLPSSNRSYVRLRQLLEQIGTIESKLKNR